MFIKHIQRSQRNLKSPCIIIFAVWLLIVGMLCPAFGQSEITFYFNPPDGSTFIETQRYTKSISAPGVLEPETRVVEQKAEYTIRKTGTGYSVVVTPIQPSQKVSEEVESIIRSMFSNVVVTYDLNTEGQLVRVRGTENVMEMLKKAIPRELYQIVLSVLGPAAQNPDKLAADMWNARGMLGIFVGRTVRLDYDYPQVSVNVSLPSIGNIVMSVKMRTSWPNPCSGKSCAKIRMSYESNDKIIGENLALMLRTMLVNAAKVIDPSVDEKKFRTSS